MLQHQHNSIYLILAFIIIIYFLPLINCSNNSISLYSPPTKIKCRKDMYSRLSILGAINSFIPTTQECYGCLYAIQNNDTFFKSCLGQEIEFGYHNFSDFVKNGCQREFECHTCYTDNCNVPSNKYEIPGVQKFSKNSFICYHGEREASQFDLAECPTKKCVIVHNFENRYWATTCLRPIKDYIIMLYPIIKNFTTVDYYYCSTSECNYDVLKLNGTTQAAAAWMKDEYPFTWSLTTVKINQSIITTRSMVIHSDSFENTTFTVIGKVLPNATMFRLTVTNYPRKPPIKLKFNIKKNYISLVVPSYPVKEYRRKLTINLSNPIEIVFNSSKLFINGTQFFNYSTNLQNIEAFIYGGEWDILASYKVSGGKTGKNETFISKVAEKFIPPISTCVTPMTSEKKVHYFLKPFISGQSLFISTKKVFRFFGVINIRLQTSPCADSDNIPLYMTLAWANPISSTSTLHLSSSYSSNMSDQQQRANISKISPNLTNNIIFNNPKLTIWSRYGGAWSDGNVYSFYSPTYNGPKDLRIEFRNNSLLIFDAQDYSWQKQTIVVKNYINIRYLVVVDPNAVIENVVVGNIK